MKVRTRLYPLVILLIVGFGLVKLNEIQFVPSINTFIKRNHLLISAITLLLLVVLLLRLFSNKSVIFGGVLVLVSIFLLTRIAAKSVLYSQYEQTVVTRLGNNIYVVKTYNPNFIVCINQYSIVKKQLFFVNKLYHIGCHEYKMRSFGPDRIEIITKYNPIVSGGETTYDTAIIDSRKGELLSSSIDVKKK